MDVTPEEYKEYHKDPGLLGDLFRRMLCERVQQWVDMADERLKGQNVRCLVTAGNDDLYEVDRILEKSETIECHDGKIIDLGEGF